MARPEKIEKERRGAALHSCVPFPLSFISKNSTTSTTRNTPLSYLFFLFPSLPLSLISSSLSLMIGDAQLRRRIFGGQEQRGGLAPMAKSGAAY